MFCVFDNSSNGVAGGAALYEADSPLMPKMNLARIDENLAVSAKIRKEL